MKLIRTALFSLLATLVLLPALVSCSDDDNEFSWDKVESMLIGEWIDDEDDDSYTLIMTLNADHTGSLVEDGDLLGNFSWSYDTPSHIMTINTEDGQTSTCEVKEVSCCELELLWAGDTTPTEYDRLK